MKYSPKKRINNILNNVQRIQELAGLSDPEAGYVAPANAYEDNYDELKKRFGGNILNKLEVFVQNNINEQIKLLKSDPENLYFTISPPNQISKDNLFPQDINQIFVKFGGYMHDAKNYVFNVGYKQNNNGEVFVARFSMDLNGSFSAWQKSIH